MKFVLLLLFTLVGCQNESTSLEFVEETAEEARAREAVESEQRQRELREQREREKKSEWKRIVSFAKESYQSIKPIVDKKCFDCHDERAKVPIYGRIIRQRNPVFLHLKDGIEALDFSQEFPLRTSNRFRPDAPEEELNIDAQISYLKAINEAAIDRTMPLRSYTLVYWNRGIKPEDKEKFLAWTNPLIDELEEYKKKYLADDSIEGRVNQVFSAKCARCHGGNADRGGFGKIEDLESLAKSKYVNLDEPEKSEIYTIVESGEMPISERERLTADELNDILVWLRTLK